MDIAAMSTIISQAKTAHQASFSVMKMAMNTSEVKMNDMVQMIQENTKIMEISVQPHLGQNIDIQL